MEQSNYQPVQGQDSFRLVEAIKLIQLNNIEAAKPILQDLATRYPGNAQVAEMWKKYSSYVPAPTPISQP